MAIRDGFMHWVSVGCLCSLLSACGGGEGDDSSSIPGPPPPVPGTSLSCDGYPRVQQTSVQACVIVQEFAQITPSVSASTNAGNVIAHGGDLSDAYVVYARIVAQAPNEPAATALAKSVVVTTTNGNIVATPDRVDSPQSLQIDFEIFSKTNTNLTLSTAAGDLTADNYNATLHFTSQAGNASLDTVQGQVSIDVGAGSIKVKLAGSGWSGTGMTASTETGNVSVSRPMAYQAAFTAESDLGTASIDSNQATTTGQAPALVTAGSGAPIALKSMVGNVAVVATQ